MVVTVFFPFVLSLCSTVACHVVADCDEPSLPLDEFEFMPASVTVPLLLASAFSVESKPDGHVVSFGSWPSITADVIFGGL